MRPYWPIRPYHFYLPRHYDEAPILVHFILRKNISHVPPIPKGDWCRIVRALPALNGRRHFTFSYRRTTATFQLDIFASSATECNTSSRTSRQLPNTLPRRQNAKKHEPLIEFRYFFDSFDDDDFFSLSFMILPHIIYLDNAHIMTSSGLPCYLKSNKVQPAIKAAQPRPRFSFLNSDSILIYWHW
jgi:hypothetical protein